MAAKIGAAIGTPVTFQAIPEEQVSNGMVERGESAKEIAAHLSIYRAIRNGLGDGHRYGGERVLGRKPISFDRWVEQNVSAFR